MTQWPIIGGVIAFVVAVLAAVFRMGKKGAKHKAENDDYENADDIRTRVERDRADELRKHDDAGWRD